MMIPETNPTSGPICTRIPRSRSPPKKLVQSLYITTTEPGSGKAMVSLGLMHELLGKTSRCGFFRPIIGTTLKQDEDIEVLLSHFKLPQSYEESYGIQADKLNELLGAHKHDQVIEIIIDKFKALEAKCDMILCEGSDYESAFEFNLNQEIAKNLACPILIVGSAHDRSTEEALQSIQITIDSFLRTYDAEIVGVVLNKCPMDQVYSLQHRLEDKYHDKGYQNIVIPYDPNLSCPRICDIVQALDGTVLYGKNNLNNAVSCSILGTMQLQNVLNWIRQDNCLIITSGDRSDILVGGLQAHRSANFPRLSGIVLTGGVTADETITRLFDGLLDGVDLPIIECSMDSFSAAHFVDTVHASLTGDTEKIMRSIRVFENHVPNRREFLKKLVTCPSRHASFKQTMTPKMFSFNLIQMAKQQQRHIVLPEGNDPRVIRAAAILAARGICQLTILGHTKEVMDTITQTGVNLPSTVHIVDPLMAGPLLDQYAKTYYELRKHKGTVPNIEAARDEVTDATTFATMMVKCGHADGLVSGARHTTRATIRPALQLIKTKPGCGIVSSVFLMCLDHHVCVYGDCAVNPNPTAEELADIAIASAETSLMFGIEPKVAMLSYSSGDSGKGDEVEKVREATRIAKERRPDLLIEGPIQYDAAVDQQVAAQKMPNSKVAGKATVFIFPDLNTGNNTYKAVQRETGAVAIGPILQGLKKPVNDLSRGCTVEDIVNTVVITACQGQEQEED